MNLSSERMELRPFVKDDFAALVSLHQDTKVMRYLTGGVPQAEDKVREFIQYIGNLDLKYEGELGYVAAIRKTDDKFLGWFHFRPDKKDPSNLSLIELGYRFHTEYWGKGYAVEGSRTLISYGQKLGYVKEVFAETLSANTRSRRVMEKLGMKLDREFPHERFPEINEYVVRYVLDVSLSLVHSKNLNGDL